MAQKSAPKKKVRRNKQHPDRPLAKVLFVSAGMGMGEIAKELGVTNKTIGEWKREDGWDTERSVENLMPVNLVKRLYEQVNAIMDDAEQADPPRRLNAKESDSIIKLSKAINILQNRLDASTLMQAYVKLNNYILEHDAELAKKLLPFEKDLVKKMMSPR